MGTSRSSAQTSCRMAFTRFIGSTDVRTAKVIWRAKPIPSIAAGRWRNGTYTSFAAASVRPLFFASATTPTTVRKTVLARSGGALSNRNAPAQRVFIGPVSAGQRLVDHRDRRRLLLIRVFQETAAQQPDAQRAEVTRAIRRAIRAILREFGLGPAAPSISITVPPFLSPRGTSLGHRRVFDAGQRPHALKQVFVESRDPLVIGIS